ncbi:SDR family NAD(P)-dependent oxidoreductase [Streptomyces sp. NPDC098090]|uniref:SDR family NAD(P)-dependent oxidoreductase n=1 Tax=Streptomyces sp. NPDC098090 TaxID=3366095 RepID=UPI0037FAF794
MKISDARVPVAGATGALGGAFLAELVDGDARPALAGRDAGRPRRAARDRPGAPVVTCDAYAPDCRARTAHDASAVLGGPDAVVVASGMVASGTADEGGEEGMKHSLTVNALAPAELLRTAPGTLAPGSVIAAVTGLVAGRPRRNLADCSASEAARSAWLRAARREKRSTGVRVLDLCPGPLETGFAGRAVAGTAAPMPPGGDPRQVAGAVVDALETNTGLPRTDPGGTPAVEGRAR